MDPMSEYLARTIINARLADADQRRQGRRIEDERRARRRAGRRLAVARWWHRITDAQNARGGNRMLAVAGPAFERLPSAELAYRLDAAAHRIADLGTAAEPRLLEAMHEVIEAAAPGTAAALVDPVGSETARLRAFGMAHRFVVHELGPYDHAWLLEFLDDGGRRRPGLVA